MSNDSGQFRFVNAFDGALNRLWLHTAALLSKWNEKTVAYENTTNVSSWGELVAWKARQIKNGEAFGAEASKIQLINTGHAKLDNLKAENKQIILRNNAAVNNILRGIPETDTGEVYLNIFSPGEIQGGLLQDITRQSAALGLSAYEAERNAKTSTSGSMGDPWNAIHKLSNIVEHISRA